MQVSFRDARIRPRPHAPCHGGVLATGPGLPKWLRMLRMRIAGGGDDVDGDNDDYDGNAAAADEVFHSPEIK